MTQLPIISDVSIADMQAAPVMVYKRLRHEAPVVLLESTGRALLTKAKDAHAVKEATAKWTSEDTTTPAERAFQDASIMRRDRPVHRTVRMAVQPGLSARKIKTDFRDIANTHAKYCLEGLSSGDTVEMFQQVAAPYAGVVLRDVLGLRGAMAADVVRWSQILIDGAANVINDEDVFARSDAVNIEINNAIDESLKRIADEPDGSVLVSMSQGTTLDRIRGNIKASIGDGVNEGRDAALTTLFGLLTHPDQFSDVKAEPGLSLNAFEEAIRGVAPIQTTLRKLRVPLSLHGIDLPEGTRGSGIRASANHDEEVYENREIFDIHRAEKSHFSFGNGSHLCLVSHVGWRGAFANAVRAFPQYDHRAPRKHPLVRVYVSRTAFASGAPVTRLSVCIPQPARDLQCCVLRSGHEIVLNAVQIEPTVGAREVHTGNNRASVIAYRDRNTRPTRFAKSARYDKARLAGFGHARCKAGGIRRRVFGETVPRLARGKGLQIVFTQCAQQAPTNRRRIGLRACACAHVGYIARARLMADKVEDIIPLKHAEVRGHARVIAQLRKDRAGDGRDGLLVQIGKAKVQYPRAEGECIGLLRLADELHLPQGIDQTEGRRAAQLHRAGDIAQRHGRLTRAQNFEHTQPPMQAGDEINIMIRRFGHGHSLCNCRPFAFNIQNALMTMEDMP